MSSRRLLSGVGFAVLLLTNAGVEEGQEGPPPAPAPQLQPATADGTSKDPGSTPQQDKPGHNGTEAGPAPLQTLDKHCAHGDRVEDGHGPKGPKYRCNCWDGWKTAGITDTLDWIEGSCNQFKCEDDDHCQRALKIEGAQCPVKGWNCYCGWKYALMDGGKGWDPLKDGEQLNGECMGVMYTFSVDATRDIKSFLEWAWMPFVTVAVLLLPFGRKRAVCDHHKPSLWNGIRRCCGCTIQCTGGCVMSTVYDLDVFKDDIAWSIWALDVMVWVYVFTLVLLITVAWITTLIVWAILLLVLLVALVAGVCMMCFAGADGGGGGAEGCDCFKVCEGGGADAAGCGGAECCSGCCGGGAMEGGAFYEPFYWGGPMPMHTHGCFYSPYYDYGYGYHGGGDCNCCGRSSCCNFFCKPVALLLYVYPTLPENMWGGLLGYFVMGTHHMTPEDRAYQGGNWIVDWMMGQRPADLHGDTGWRRQVYDFLAQDDYDNPVYPQPGRTNPGQEVLYQAAPGVSDDPNVVRISAHCRAFRIHPKTFDMEEHRLWESSYDDYKKNVCWICQGQNDNWDMWMSCRHMFCESCSTQMLKRRMPCPLCRVSSNTVLRGPAYDGTPPSPPGTDQGASSTEPYGRPERITQGPRRTTEGDPFYGRGRSTLTGQEMLQAPRSGALQLQQPAGVYVAGRQTNPGGSAAGQPRITDYTRDQRGSRDAPPL